MTPEQVKIVLGSPFSFPSGATAIESAVGRAMFAASPAGQGQFKPLKPRKATVNQPRGVGRVNLDRAIAMIEKFGRDPFNRADVAEIFAGDNIAARNSITSLRRTGHVRPLTGYMWVFTVDVADLKSERAAAAMPRNYRLADKFGMGEFTVAEAEAAIGVKPKTLMNMRTDGKLVLVDVVRIKGQYPKKIYRLAYDPREVL